MTTKHPVESFFKRERAFADLIAKHFGIDLFTGGDRTIAQRRERARARAAPMPPAGKLLLPAQRQVACSIDPNPHHGHLIQLAHDETAVLEITPAQMDQICDWWAQQGRTAA